jgi:hypothetical protein
MSTPRPLSHSTNDRLSRYLTHPTRVKATTASHQAARHPTRHLLLPPLRRASCAAHLRVPLSTTTVLTPHSCTDPPVNRLAYCPRAPLSAAVLLPSKSCHRGPLFQPPPLIGASAPHRFPASVCRSRGTPTQRRSSWTRWPPRTVTILSHCSIFIARKSRRISSMRSNSFTTSRHMSFTRAPSRQSQAAASFSFSVSCCTTHVPSSFLCCGKILTPSRSCRSMPEPARTFTLTTVTPSCP